MQRLELSYADYRLTVAPQCGGAIAAFEWRGEPLFRRSSCNHVLSMACFPMVPFANRIDRGQFAVGRRTIRLAPNFPGDDHPHPLHGWGWLSEWSIECADDDHIVLGFTQNAGEWPWTFAAWQEFHLGTFGLRHVLRVKNCSDTPMPSGLGLHPYLPLTRSTRLHALHHGEWQTDGSGLPVRLKQSDEPRDWCEGGPVSDRIVDTVYTERVGPMIVGWPERHLELCIDPSEELPFTAIYVPPSGDFFCVEPMSHSTNAINRPASFAEMRMLAPGEDMSVSIDYRAREMAEPLKASPNAAAQGDPALHGRAANAPRFAQIQNILGMAK